MNAKDAELIEERRKMIEKETIIEELIEEKKMKEEVMMKNEAMEKEMDKLKEMLVFFTNYYHDSCFDSCLLGSVLWYEFTDLCPSWSF